MYCVPWILPQISFDFERNDDTDEKTKNKRKTMIEDTLCDQKLRLDIFEQEKASLRAALPRNQMNVCKELINTCALKGKKMMFIGDAPGHYASILLKNDKTVKWLAINAKTDPLYFKVLRNNENGMQWCQEDKPGDDLKWFYENTDLVISNTCYNVSIYNDLENEYTLEFLKKEILFALKMQQKNGTFLFGMKKPKHYFEFQLLYWISCIYEHVSLLTPKTTESTELYVCAHIRKCMTETELTRLENVLKNDEYVEIPELWITETLLALDQILFARVES